jgi:hypothetical protein
MGRADRRRVSEIVLSSVASARERRASIKDVETIRSDGMKRRSREKVGAASTTPDGDQTVGKED